MDFRRGLRLLTTLSGPRFFSNHLPDVDLAEFSHIWAGLWCIQMIILPFCCSLFTQLYPAASASACDLRGKIRAKSKRAKAILMSFVIRASGAGCSGKWTRTSPRRSGWCTQCRSWLWSVRRMILSGNSLLSTTPGAASLPVSSLSSSTGKWWTLLH